MADSFMLYKMIILYMLNRVNFPLTTAQISDFILSREYTNFLTLQRALGELTDAGLIETKTVRNRTQLFLTADGRQTLDFFHAQLGPSIRSDVDSYLKDNEMELREEVSVFSDYFKTGAGEYEAHLKAKDGSTTLIDLMITVPLEETAAEICNNWQKKNQEIYQYVIQQLF